MKILESGQLETYREMLPISSLDLLSYDECLKILGINSQTEKERGLEIDTRPWQTIESIIGSLTDDIVPDTAYKYNDITPSSLIDNNKSEVDEYIAAAERILLVGCIAVSSYVELCRNLSAKNFSGTLTVIDRSPRPLACCKIFNEKYPSLCGGIETTFMPVRLSKAYEYLQQKYEVVLTDAVDGYIGDPAGNDLDLMMPELVTPVLKLLSASGIWVSRLSGKKKNDQIRELRASSIYKIIEESGELKVISKKAMEVDGRQFIEFVGSLKQ